MADGMTRNVVPLTEVIGNGNDCASSIVEDSERPLLLMVLLAGIVPSFVADRGTQPVLRGDPLKINVIPGIEA